MQTLQAPFILGWLVLALSSCLQPSRRDTDSFFARCASSGWTAEGPILPTIQSRPRRFLVLDELEPQSMRESHQTPRRVVALVRVRVALSLPSFFPVPSARYSYRWRPIRNCKNRSSCHQLVFHCVPSRR